jgi:predicted ribosomally synthesized peptide with SipW-like signal peptide
MLVGTTYAWFTDSVTSAGNIIKAGTLDVTMEWAEGNLDPDTATWTDASKGAMFDNDLWEPGYVEAKHIKISNVGSLALNYKLRIVANGIVSKLANVIDVYYFENATQLTRETATSGTCLGTLAQVLGSGVDSANALHQYVKGSLGSEEEASKDTTDELEFSTTLTLALKMRESAGNEYQGLELGTFSIELIATQMSYEFDSFNNEYDKVVPD